MTASFTLLTPEKMKINVYEVKTYFFLTPKRKSRIKDQFKSFKDRESACCGQKSTEFLILKAKLFSS